MVKKVYNKAIRDKIPEIIENSGYKFKIKILNDNEFLIELEQKLQEEINEYLDSKDTQELVDLLEIIKRISELRNSSFDELMLKMKEKEVLRGGFKRNIFLEYVIRK